MEAHTRRRSPPPALRALPPQGLPRMRRPAQMHRQRRRQGPARFPDATASPRDPDAEQDRAEDNRVAPEIRDPRRLRGHRLRDRSCPRPAELPLPRHGQNPRPTRADGSRNEHHPTQRIPLTGHHTTPTAPAQEPLPTALPQPAHLRSPTASLLWSCTDVAVRALDEVPGRLRYRRDLNPRTDRGRPAPSPSVDMSGTSLTSIAMDRSATAPQPAGMRAIPLRLKVEDLPLRSEPLSSTGNRFNRATGVEPEPVLASKARAMLKTSGSASGWHAKGVPSRMIL